VEVYVVFSFFSSQVISLIATNKISVLFSIVCKLLPNKLH